MRKRISITFLTLILNLPAWANNQDPELKRTATYRLPLQQVEEYPAPQHKLYNNPEGLLFYILSYFINFDIGDALEDDLQKNIN